ncbi:MAG TPA: hypothetical protein VNW28_06005 [Chthoniobacterales bacterium]|nr:hypothetical protein [Chthoniobacterales bacterium]
MKSALCLTRLKTALLVVPLSLYFCGPRMAEGRDRSLLPPGVVRPGNRDYLARSTEGSLTVYVTGDEFNDAWYFPRSVYAIYTIDGKLFKSVESQYSADEEIPDVVALPFGSYLVIARSEKKGYIRRPVVIEAGRRTILDLDLREEGSLRRIAHS